MKLPHLTDQTVQPDKALIDSLLGKKSRLYEKLLEKINCCFEGSVSEWRFYKDAKRWLMPIALKKKNICWLSLADHSTWVSIWFGKRFEPLFETGHLPESVKERFRKAEVTKMGRGILIKLDGDKDIEDVLKILDFKSKLK